MEKKEEPNEEIRPEEGEIYILDVKAETSEIKVTGSVFLPAELQCRSDAVSFFLSPYSFIYSFILCSSMFVLLITKRLWVGVKVVSVSRYEKC